MIHSFLLLFVVAAGFCVEPAVGPKCWRGGVFNEKTGFCDCPEGWKNLKGEKPGECQSKSCTNGNGPDSDDKCACVEGWKGLNCDLCDHHHFECKHLHYCKESLISEKNLHVNCEVHEESMKKLMGNTTTIQIFDVGTKVKKGKLGNAFFQTWAYDNDGKKEAEVFWCNLLNCQMKELPNKGVSYHCNSTVCECNLGPLGSRICKDEKAFQYVVENMKRSCKVDCKENGSCEFQHTDFPATVLMTCKAGECIPFF